MNEVAENRYESLDQRRPRAGLSLPVKLLLAVISGYGMWPAGELGDRVDQFLPLRILDLDWPVVLGGALFGALVMAPLINARSLRVLRVLALCICSVVAFRLAIEVAIDDPLGNAEYVSAGFVGAELVAVSVMIFAPVRFNWRIFIFAGLAGAVGGEAFNHLGELKGDFLPMTAYAVWQTLVCLALHFGVRASSAQHGQSAAV